MQTTTKIKLNLLGLPVIQDLDDLSRLTRLSKHRIFQLSARTQHYYRIFDISKKSGGLRRISQPSRQLKGLQAWVLRNILDKLKVSSACKGFELGSSTLQNAVPHRGANCVMTLDLEDFFPSVNRSYVYNVFHSVGYNKLIAAILTNICTYNGSLPQGSPCSPKLANLVSWRLDKRLQGYVGKRGIVYTRYADDLTFSGLNPAKVVKAIPMIKFIIAEEHFGINDEKTRVAGPARAKRITGLILSDDSIGIGKRHYKLLRAKVHHLTLKTEQENIPLVQQVNGWLAYLKSVDQKRLNMANKYIRKLRTRYPDTLVTTLRYDI